MMQLFEGGAQNAAVDIAAFLREVSEHQPNRQYKHRITPLKFSRFITAMHDATGGNNQTMQKIICELLDRESIRKGADVAYNSALDALEASGILRRRGIEGRVTKPVYILTEDYYPVIFHLVEPVGKLKLAKARPLIPKPS